MTGRCRFRILADAAPTNGRGQCGTLRGKNLLITADRRWHINYCDAICSAPQWQRSLRGQWSNPLRRLVHRGEETHVGNAGRRPILFAEIMAGNCRAFVRIKRHNFGEKLSWAALWRCKRRGCRFFAVVVGKSRRRVQVTVAAGEL